MSPPKNVIHRLCVLDMTKNLCLWGTFYFVGVRGCPVCGEHRAQCLVYAHDGAEYALSHTDGTGHFLSISSSPDGIQEYHPLKFESPNDVRPLYAPLLQQIQELRAKEGELAMQEHHIRVQKESVETERRRLTALVYDCTTR